MKQTHKKLILGLLSTLLLIAATIGITIGIIRSGHQEHNNPRRLSPTTHAILKNSCSSTLYPNLCYSAIASDPTRLIDKISTRKGVIIASINITKRAVEHNSFTVENLIKTRNNLTIREKNALHDCLETIYETLDELTQALQDLLIYPNINKKKKKIRHGRYSYSLEDYADDMKTLISSAMTNQETCFDGFSHNNADKHVREVLESGRVHVERMCSNSLAMIKNLTDADIALAKINSNKRQLYDQHYDDYGSVNSNWPWWMSSGDRRVLQQGPMMADVVVAADGSGNYRTVTEAVAGAPTKGKKRYVIRIKAGVYEENVVVTKKKTNIMFVGDGRTKTIISGSKNVVDGSTTYDSATVAIMGEGFLARDLTFQNKAGPTKHQAVALRVGADLAAFYQCDILAYQDTLYVHKNRQFYINCLIAGTVDFIFGNAAVVFQDCDIHVRKPNPDQKNMITAQSRNDPNQNTGIVIQKCRIGATSELQAMSNDSRTYLGRPWKEYSRTVVMQSAISDVVHPAGWHEWNGEFGLKTLHYAEYKNNGRGADTSKRVQWKGIRVISNVAEAQQFTAEKFIAGGSWLGSTTFPFSLGL